MGTVYEPPAYLLSHHSSNPLQVPSDDSLNAAYVSQLRPLLDAEKARAAHGLPPVTSSTPSASISLDEDPDELIGAGDVTFRPSTSLNDVTIDFGHLPTHEMELSHQAQGDPDVDEDDDGVNVQLDGLGDAADVFDDSLYDATMLVDPQQAADYNEEHSIMLRPPEERAQVQLEIRDLESAVPRILRDYRLLDRLGEGKPCSQRHILYSLTLLNNHRHILNRLQSYRYNPRTRSYPKMASSHRCPFYKSFRRIEANIRHIQSAAHRERAFYTGRVPRVS